jgi:site-specific DNA-methyltransferase (adenine-specific)
MTTRIEIIGNATLYLGDCRDILPTLPKVDLVLTDPPYGIGFAASPTKWQRLDGKLPEEWDDEAPDFIAEVLSIGESAMVWGGNYFALPPSRGWLSWFKPDAPPSMAHFEMCWTSFDMNARQLSCSISQTNPERVGHPTQKPLRLIEWCINLAPKTTSTVADPFMGSGTTGVACANLGKTFYGIEREPKYFDIACQRIENAYRQERLFA